MPDVPSIAATGSFTGAEVRASIRAMAGNQNRVRAARPIEWFGASSVDYAATPTDNAAAFADAVDWCAETGGKVIIGAGVYGVDGPTQLRSYANFEGLARHHSRVQQLTAGQDVFTSLDTAGNSIYGCEFRNFEIHGGWAINWTTDIATATAAGIRLIGSNGGPDEQIALDRESALSFADPYHVIEGMRFNRIFGDGIYLAGRGEMNVRFNRIGRVARYGINCNAPDNWFTGNTISSTGNSGFYLTAGNNRLVSEKYWFNGSHEGQEVVGAGLEIDGAGVANTVCMGVTTQDTWGPGLVADGDSLIFYGNIDEAGGGRLEQQLGGWRSGRTKQRSFIRLSTASRSRIEASLGGGGRIAGSPPHLVDVDASGAAYNHIEVRTEGVTTTTARVRVSAGNATAKRYNAVIENGRYRVGRLTSAQIADAAHTIQSDGPDIVPLDPSGMAVRDASGGGWTVHAGSTVTPA